MTVRFVKRQHGARRRPGDARIAKHGDATIRWTRVNSAALDLFRASPLDRIQAVREGVPAGFLERLSEAMFVSRERVFHTVGLARATADRKIDADDRLTPNQSERVVGLTRLIGHVQAMVEESGNPKGFDAARWVGEWLDQPHPALGGHKPGEYMDTAEGCTLVSHLLAQQQSGAYA